MGSFGCSSSPSQPFASWHGVQWVLAEPRSHTGVYVQRRVCARGWDCPGKEIWKVVIQQYLLLIDLFSFFSIGIRVYKWLWGINWFFFFFLISSCNLLCAQVWSKAYSHGLRTLRSARPTWKPWLCHWPPVWLFAPYRLPLASLFLSTKWES